MPIELDNNATTKPLPEVIEAMTEMLERAWHNPSSMHRSGQAARQRVELARASVARLIGARAKSIVFTSGATESIHLAIRGTLAFAPESRRTIVTSAIEHEAVRDLCGHLASRKGDPFRVVHAPLTASGAIDPARTVALLDDSVAMVSLQWANNETGVIHEIGPIAEACRERGIPFHTDATQMVGKMPVDVGAMAMDLLSCSAHKMHGPKGVGALYVRPRLRLEALFQGPHELERRGGTENVPGIVGFGVAAESAAAWLGDGGERERLASLRDSFERAILGSIPGASVNGNGAERLWNTTNIAFPPLEAEPLLMLLSERPEGEAVNASAGAACSSGSLDPSPVLLAMGVPEREAHGSLRFSMSRLTEEREIEAGVGTVVECVRRLARSATSVIG